MPLKGCFLSPDTDATPFIIRGGIPYGLQLEFNKYDRLTDIALRYARRGKITRDECLSLYGRTLDWASQEFGPFYASLGETKHLKQRRSPGGIAFGVFEQNEPHFVTNFVRTSNPPPSAAVQAKPIGKWDNERYVSLLSYYIVATDEPNCEIMIDFNEAPSVERRPMEKQPESTEIAEPAAAQSEEADVSLDGTDEELAEHDGWIPENEWNAMVGNDE